MNPLPEAMLSYTWSFGALSEADERTYLAGMFSAGAAGQAGPLEEPLHRSLCAALVFASQRFAAREAAELGAVSLRDPARLCRLLEWFRASLRARRADAAAPRGSFPGGVGRLWSGAPAEPAPLPAETELRAILLSLSHCYLCRMSTDEQRAAYLDTVSHELRRFIECVWQRKK